ncbi:MAG: hypothetical protein KF852_06065 [Saprospiraceae bacterium]|nr:hypothetical protein [Saprospiraceae bacterium]
MKQLSFILLFSAALLAALSPCTEAFLYALETGDGCGTEKTCCSKAPATEKKKTTGHCGDHSEENHGQCSSLCHCSCCAHVATAFFSCCTYPEAEQEVREKPNYYSGYNFEFSEYVWRPPNAG